MVGHNRFTLSAMRHAVQDKEVRAKSLLDSAYRNFTLVFYQTCQVRALSAVDRNYAYSV